MLVQQVLLPPSHLPGLYQLIISSVIHFWIAFAVHSGNAASSVCVQLSFIQGFFLSFCKFLVALGSPSLTCLLSSSVLIKGE